MSSMTDGDKAWLGLAIYVVTYDALAQILKKETLSASFGKALDKPITRWPTIVAWTYLTGHLFRAIPPKWDPARDLL